MARALVETRPLFKVTTLGERRGRLNDDFFFLTNLSVISESKNGSMGWK